MNLLKRFQNKPVWRWLALSLLILLAIRLTVGLPVSARYPVEDISYQKPLRAVQGLPGGAHYPAVRSTGALPRLDVGTAYHDFGRVSQQRPVDYTFVLYNRGQADLLVRRAYTTCECTTAQLSGSVIPAGKAALVVVEYDPRLHSSPGTTVRRGVILETNDPEQTQLELWVQAQIR